MTTPPLLAHDGSPSCGKTIFGVAALGVKESVLLDVSEVAGKKAIHTKGYIEDVLANLRSLASAFPETEHLCHKMRLEGFSGTMSDHTAVNTKISKELWKKDGVSADSLPDLKCSPHKSNLLDTTFKKRMGKERKERPGGKRTGKIE
jgi:hypothetical protein